MNIGITRQQQLSVIQYVHKRANKIGLILGGIVALATVIPLISFGIRLADSAIVLSGFGYGVVLLVGGMFYARCFLWTFYWLGSKLGVEALFGLAVMLNPFGEEHYTEGEYIGDGKFKLTSATATTFSIPVLIIALIVATICFWIGLYFAIKYTIMGFRLKRQMNRGMK